MRILFIGSGTLACPALDLLLLRPQEHRVVGLVTQPDRPQGRHLRPAPCPAKHHMESRGIPILTPVDINTPDSIEALAALKPDMVVVASFGQFLKRPILELAPMGTINIHPSLLPKYRGAAPVHWAILNGDTVTGVTIMHVSMKMDAGDIILQEEHPIGPEETAGALEVRLAVAGAHLLGRALDELAGGRARRTPQDAAQVVLAPKLHKTDGRIDWSQSAEHVHNRIRGLHPWPGAFTVVPCRGHSMRLKIHEARVVPGEGLPGTVLSAGASGLVVACGRDAIHLIRVQPESRGPMDAAAFCCGHALQPGARWTDA